MPIDYSNYPPNWKTEIRPRILRRAADHCERCGAPNGAIIVRNVINPAWFRVLKFKETDEALKELDRLRATNAAAFLEFAFWRKPIKVVLTIAHYDHNVADSSDKNLRAWCQMCHNRHDAKHRAARRAQTLADKRFEAEEA